MLNLWISRCIRFIKFWRVSDSSNSSSKSIADCAKIDIRKVNSVISISGSWRYWYLWQMGEGFIAWSSMWDTRARRAWNLFLRIAAKFGFYVRRSRRMLQNDVISQRSCFFPLFFFSFVSFVYYNKTSLICIAEMLRVLVFRKLVYCSNIPSTKLETRLTRPRWFHICFGFRTI